MKGIKAILFDFDETLTDAKAGGDAAYAAVTERLWGYLKEHGVEIVKEKLAKDLRQLSVVKNVNREYDRDKWWPEFLSRFDVKLPDKKFMKETTDIYWQKFAEANVPFPDAENVLRELRKRGYKLGLITDTDGYPGRKWSRLKGSPLLKFFDAVVIGGDDTPHSKPDPAPFLLTAKKLGVRPAECVMVGDKPFTDIRGGKAAGMKTIRMMQKDWGAQEEKADFTVESLTELLELL